MKCGETASHSDDTTDCLTYPAAVVSILLDCGINPQAWIRDWVDLLSMVGEIEEFRNHQ